MTWLDCVKQNVFEDDEKQNITKTSLFKYIENFIPKKLKIFR